MNLFFHSMSLLILPLSDPYKNAPKFFFIINYIQQGPVISSLAHEQIKLVELFFYVFLRLSNEPHVSSYLGITKGRSLFGFTSLVYP